MDELQDFLGLGDNEFAKYILTHDLETERKAFRMLTAIWEKNLELEDEFRDFMTQPQYATNGVLSDIYRCEWGPYKAEYFSPDWGDGEFRITKNSEKRTLVTDKDRAFGPGVDTPVYLPDGTMNPHLFDRAIEEEE